MKSNHLDYLKLLQEFVKESSFHLYQNKSGYRCAEYFKVSLVPGGSEYRVVDNFHFTPVDCPQITRIDFDPHIEASFYGFLNQKPERWNLFMQSHPIRIHNFFNALSFIPDKFLYSFIKNFQVESFSSLTEKQLHGFFKRIQDCSQPLNTILLCDFLSQFKNQFKNDSLVVALAHNIKTFSSQDKKQFLKSLAISYDFENDNHENFLQVIDTLSLSLDKVQLISFLSHKNPGMEDKITKDLVWQQLEILAKYFKKPQTHKNSFFCHAINDGYNNSFDCYQIHIHLKENFSQKSLLKSFIQTSIVELVSRQLDNKSLKEKEQFVFLKKLYDFMELNEKFPQKNNSLKTTLSKI